jgi:hypothetical protein
MTLTQTAEPTAEFPSVFPYEGLKAPYADAPDPAERPVPADVSVEPWDGDIGAPTLGREYVIAPPAVRDYVVRVKAAGQAAADLDPTLAGLGDFAALLNLDATKGREALAKAWRTADEMGLDRETPAARVAKADIAAAVQERADVVIDGLRRAEQQALHDLDQLPLKRVTEPDYKWASDMGQTLQLMGPKHSVPLLMNALVLRPASRDGEGAGKAAALLPILKGMHDADTNGYGTHEIANVIRLAEAVLRDAKWYGAHARLRAIRAAQFKVQSYAEQFTEALGDASSPHFTAARSPFYSELRERRTVSIVPPAIVPPVSDGPRKSVRMLRSK